MGEAKQWTGACEPETAFLGCIEKENGGCSTRKVGEGQAESSYLKRQLAMLAALSVEWASA